MMQQMMSSMMAQPGFMDSIMASHPQLRTLMDANPQVSTKQHIYVNDRHDKNGNPQVSAAQKT